MIEKADPKCKLAQPSSTLLHQCLYENDILDPELIQINLFRLLMISIYNKFISLPLITQGMTKNEKSKAKNKRVKLDQCVDLEEFHHTFCFDKNNLFNDGRYSIIEFNRKKRNNLYQNKDISEHLWRNNYPKSKFSETDHVDNEPSYFSYGGFKFLNSEIVDDNQNGLLYLWPNTDETAYSMKNSHKCTTTKSQKVIYSNLDDLADSSLCDLHLMKVKSLEG